MAGSRGVCRHLAYLGPPRALSAMTVASEPTDPLPGWTPVPDGAVLTATPGRAETQPISADRTGAR